MIRAYLLAFLMLGLGLAGVVVVATQATRSPKGSQAETSGPADAMEPQATAPMKARPNAMRIQPMAKPVTADAGVMRPRPKATGDAGVAQAADGQAPARPVAVDATAPAPATGPPTHPGGTPALTVQFTEGSTRITKAVRRAIRKLVKEHGYKDVQYKLTGYGAERRRPKSNRALARRRCRKVARLIRKRGVSRRWIECEKPVFRDVKRKATDADKVEAWRRVDIRVKKP